MILKTLFSLPRCMRNLRLKETELEKLQNKKLREMIEFAYRSVPFYHRIWKDLGISPKDIKTKDDLKKLPVINKADIKSDYTQFHSNFIDSSKCIFRNTAGTTGTPTTIRFDIESSAYLDSIYLRALFENGYRPWNKFAYFAMTNSNRIKIWEKFGIMRKHYIPIVSHENVQLDMLNKINPRIVYSNPSTLYTLARLIKDNDLISVTPKIIISQGELLTEEIRSLIENVFHSEIFNHYGTNEFTRIGWECEEHDGFHIETDSVITEFLKENEEVSTGERGKLVVTGLINKAMPLIRYDVGDIAIPSKDKCSCGRSFQKMAIEGRREDFIEFPSGRIMGPRILLHYLLPILFNDEIYQIKLKQRSKTVIEVLLVNDKNFSKATVEKIDNLLKSSIEEDIKFEYNIKGKEFIKGSKRW